jgi:hypothetical protein
VTDLIYSTVPNCFPFPFFGIEFLSAEPLPELLSMPWCGPDRPARAAWAVQRCRGQPSRPGLPELPRCGHADQNRACADRRHT